MKRRAERGQHIHRGPCKRERAVQRQTVRLLHGDEQCVAGWEWTQQVCVDVQAPPVDQGSDRGRIQGLGPVQDGVTVYSTDPGQSIWWRPAA
jgi:hypothetical protein